MMMFMENCQKTKGIHLSERQKRFFCVVIVLLWMIQTATIVCAQSNASWGVQTRMKTGFLLGHRGVMGHLPRQRAYATEVSYVFRADGTKIWHESYKYPDLGVHVFYGSVGNTQILGNYIGLYGSIAFPFVAKDNFRFSGRLGCGLGYTNKVYDPQTNRKNVAISTPLNALLEVGVDVSTYFGKNRQHWLTFGIDATHFSNGSFKVPNLGINIPYISLAYGRFLSIKNSTPAENLTKIVPQRKLLFGLTAIASVKDIFPTGRDKKYGVYALSVHARTFLRPKVGWELSLDLISKQALYGYRTEVQKQANKIPQVGLCVGYLLPLDKFHFVVGMGAYVRDFYDPEGLFYHRMGMRYYFDNGLLINVVVKTHWARADYVEWGIGYSFFNRQKTSK